MHGLGLVVDIIVGIVGAVIGGYFAGALGVSVGRGLIASIIVAVIGAICPEALGVHGTQPRALPRPDPRVAVRLSGCTFVSGGTRVRR